MKNFDKLLEKKGRPLSPVEQRAKGDVLSGLSDGSDAMGDKLAGLKKVSVAAPSEKGLEKGLNKAKELLGGLEHESQEEDLNEKPMEECSPEEIDQKIQALIEYKKALLQNEQE